LYLLYIDESGRAANPAEHFVLGGLCLHESEVKRMHLSAESILTQYLGQSPDAIEIHADHIRSGRGRWRSIPIETRDSILRDLCNLLGRAPALFCVVRAPEAVASVDPLERSLEELLLRFHSYLARLRGPSQKRLGIVVADKSRYEATVQQVVYQWRSIGTRFGRLHRLVEVPLFIDSRATRMVQLADVVVHVTYRRYTAADKSLFELILPGFVAESGIRHGLVHLAKNYRSCPCPACISRRLRAA
jgi:hypothetical protein